MELLVRDALDAHDRGSGGPALRRALTAAPVLLFIVHAMNYLYFFVDDEGIPLVFARHLIRGEGLSYNTFEGRVEGYSDLLHVIVSAGWLLAARALHLGPLAPLVFGKAVSFASGVALVWLVGRTLCRDPRISVPGAAAGALWLATAPGLAMWSCSSLEPALAALLTAILTVGLFCEAVPAWTVTIAAVALVLLRIDGFVYAGAVLVPALVAAPRPRRAVLLRQVAAPLVATLLLYTAWRVWYFGEWLTEPIAAKILYKLRPAHDLVVRRGATSYGWGFLETYGGIAAAAGIVLLAGALRRERRAWPVGAAVLLLAVYAGVVGDWMSGFRFFLPLLPAAAILVAMGVTRIRRPRAAWAMTAVLAVWFGAAAVHAAARYDQLEYRTSWWLHPSFEPERYFSWYLRLAEDLRPMIPPRTRIAYNQAGMLPYLLDADNLDDLGVCSRFVARLPTTDVVFTEVGRYSPLTNSFALRAANAYVLYRAPDFVIVPLDLARTANPQGLPPAVLRGRYTRIGADEAGNAVVYRRNAASLREFRRPEAFLENLAHPSRLLRGFDGQPAAPGSFAARFPFLAEGVLDRSFTGRVRYEVVFASRDLPVYELALQNVWSRAAATITVGLSNASGALVDEEQRTIPAGRSVQLVAIWPHALPASELSIVIDAAGPTRIRLYDLRVQGQSPALAAYARQLPFPGSK